jgi:tyrosyl-tRNA synthetase
MENMIQARDEISSDVMKQAEELARSAEILPEGVFNLAKKIQQARDENRPLRIKLGVDPTASQLHLGHTVVLRRLRRFQDFGHQAVLIIGGATAQIGDPSGRDSTRPQLSPQQVRENAQTFLDQVKGILDLSKTEVVNNADWISSELIPNILQIGTKITLNELGSRFKEREEAGGSSATLTEAMYQILQGWDSVHVRADVEIGGRDQRSNMLMGRQLQQNEGQIEQVVLMLPTLLGTDGVRKMSKSFGNAITLTDSPDDIFGKCMRLPDTLIEEFFRLATMASKEEVEREAEFIKSGGNPRDAKERLARKVILELHSEEAAEAAAAKWRALHTERKAPADMPSHLVAEATGLLSVLVDTGLAASKSRARDLILGGGVRIDGDKVTDVKLVIDLKDKPDMQLSVGNRADKFVRLVREKV